MVCWLVFLPKVAGFLKALEENAGERKRLAIEVLRELEKEEGHDKEKIRKRIDGEGAEGMLRIAERMRRKKKKESEQVQEENCEGGGEEVAGEAGTN